MLSSIYGSDASSNRVCQKLLQRFNNFDFSLKDRHSGGRKKVFEDAKFERLLNEDLRQAQGKLAWSLGVTQHANPKILKSMGINKKEVT